MTEQKKTLSIDFNYLEMLGLHDYSRFKNKSLKDIVLLALEKEITSDKDYLDSLLDNKKELLLTFSEPELIEKTPFTISIDEPKPPIHQEQNFIDDSISLNEPTSEIPQPIKKTYKSQPRFLKDEPLRTVTPKKKKSKPKAKPKPKTSTNTNVKKK